MTSHKPFTAEQLDELDKLGPGELLTSELERLIAQAREEIRLREENARLCVDLKAAVRDVVDRASLQLQAQNEILDEALKQTNLLVPDQCVDIHGQHYGIASCREVLLALKAETGAPEDPAARAKREVDKTMPHSANPGIAYAVAKAQETTDALGLTSPLTRAKRELGEFLVSPEGQGFSVRIVDRGPTWIAPERWIIRLRSSMIAITRYEPTEHEAITAALRAAKETP